MDLTTPSGTVPMDYGGPPGQTQLGNLGADGPSGHRAVTHGGWQKHQPEPGYIVHRSPAGYIYLATNQGTLGPQAAPVQRCRPGGIKDRNRPRSPPS